MHIKIFHPFLKILSQHSIVIHRSCLGTLQQNGQVECKLDRILTIIWAMLLSASLLESFGGEATLTAIYTINHLPSSILDNCTLYELLYGMSPDYSILWIFGCSCFVFLSPHEHNKLQTRSHLCCFHFSGPWHRT